MKRQTTVNRESGFVLKLILGRAGFGKTRRIYQLIEQTGKTSSGQILIVPEQFSFESERAAAEMPVKSENFEVLSFSRLCDLVFKTYGGVSTETIDDAGRTVFMAATVDQLSDGILAYKKILKHPDFIKSMVATVKEFKNCAISPEMLKSAAASLPDGSLKRRISEISLLYQGYDALVSEGFSDPLDRISRACKLLDGKDFFKGKTVFLDAFKGFTQQQLELIKRIIVSADKVYITLPCDEMDNTNPDIFFSVRQTARSLRRICLEENVEFAEPEELSENHRHLPPLKAMESNIFAGHDMKIPPAEDCITLYSADKRYDEVDFAASEISRLVRKEGYRFREISVIAKNAEEYAPVIETVFSRHGIPFFIDARRPVSGQPLMIAVRAALETVISGFSTEKLLTFLKCGLSELSEEEIFQVENYCFLWKIDRGEWKKPFSKNPRGMEEGLEERDKKELERLNFLREKIINPFIKFREDIKDASCFKDYAAATFSFLCAQKADLHLSELANDFAQKGDLETADLTERSWDVLVCVLDKIALLCQGGKNDLMSFYSLLSNLFSLLDMGASPKGIDQVNVGSASRTRPAQPRAVFILGANDGVFPGLSAQGGLLSDADRAKLLEANLPVNDRSAKGLCEEGFLFYTSVCAPSEKLYISYILGGEMFPSPPVIQIKNTFNITPISEKTRQHGIDCEYSAFEKLCADYRSGSSLSGAINAYFKELNSQKLNTLTNFENRTQTDISKETSKKLFSDRLTVSPTSVESYHRCGFMYLCRAGLKARAKKPVEIDSQSRGTLVHHVFEKMFLKYGSKGLFELSDDRIAGDVHQLVYDFARTQMGCAQIEGSLEYSLENTEQLLTMIIKHMAKEMCDGKFVTLRCELPIGRKQGDSIPAFSVALDSGERVNVTGVVDRLDVYEADQKLYFRVIDYKTGQKTFTLDELPYGLGLQMLIYLFAVEEHFGKQGKNPVPAGVLYMPAREARINDGQNQNDLDKQLRMKGLVLDNEEIISAMDPGRTGKYIPINFSNSKSGHGQILPSSFSSLASERFFENTKQHIISVLKKMGQNIFDGKFPADPLDSGGVSGCKYCDFAAVCPHSGQTVHRTVSKLCSEQKKEILKGVRTDEQ